SCRRDDTRRDYFLPRSLFFLRLSAPLPLLVGAGKGLPAATPIAGGFAFGSSLRSAMPHRLDAMKYKHNPLGTLKNITPMKIIMYCIIFCCSAACSSAG